MSGFLIDTNVISEFVKPDPDPNVRTWFRTADPAILYASVVTAGAGMVRQQFVADHQRDRGPVSRITIAARRKGLMLTTTDGLLASTAFEHGLILVTRNMKDFAGPSVPLINPWDS